MYNKKIKIKISRYFLFGIMNKFGYNSHNICCAEQLKRYVII